ncbi:nucleotidyltransferase and HEPN domain-containing protein [Novosphingobium sp. SL115]|uniref:nucleotidyltransferase and HEPN domain-containing protein n=1 Tax=Novosphingobium sp. SL115 TaxID=2995150 RepID=UPI002273E6F9|nr:nucleotidyltransferase and HEPN domain-containing protein [Novosphingobium sp. SL115]MCY1669467.1 nucleotidyltransferase and HEPN domain-containing protein [Novosphingobium sp. SL115]
MRHDLDHLPAGKQRELARVLQLIFAEFEDVTACASEQRKKAGRILKVVLYGSYARGGWIDEPHTAKGYKSDFDLLIIVNHKDLTDRVKYWSRLDEHLMREYGISGTLKTPVNFIVHTLGEVNDGLAHGRYFFMDVARDGIALYESDDTELHTPKPKTPEQALAMAKEYFEEWYPAAAGRLDTARYTLKQGRMREAAFDLHQSAEFLYHCALLVVTFYTPHVHNLAFLRTQAERIDRRLTYVWPTDNRKQRAMFEKLKEAYVKARYSRHYSITLEELAWLGEQIEELGRVVHAVCAERIIALQEQCARTGLATGRQ